jgi:REP element-mobilizing transposase RayT
VELMRRLEAFSGVLVLTYALMSNHFHLLCEVPEPKALSELELVKELKGGFAQDYNRRHGRYGVLWAEREPQCYWSGIS